ncbi:siderophore-interacting protein [Gimesia panareensis]|uniref:siderophore-interacting protein n=1 Tax=Gimesia panareensis TaxID=2527978 RepID=UPI00118C2757|nr:siderophore-interacting protein [Gimesia panareensis]QDU50713.1 Vibriobactin utilization protein ViuB [Gimesia panareensis]
MANRPVRELKVIRTTRLTEHMLRITLGGDEMTDYPSDQESAYVKLMFPQAGDQPPQKRSYTIRQQRPMEIDLDFVLHDPLGPASSWAKQAQPGDRILAGDPGPKKLINPDADWFLLVGDMAALPAISVNLEQLPDDAKGHAVIEIPSKADIQTLKAPGNLNLHWEVNPQPDPEGGFLISKVKALPWLEGQPSVWSACEFNSMRNLRRFFKEEKQLPDSHLYLSSYWKIGQSDEGHKQAKRLDSVQSETTR